MADPFSIPKQERQPAQGKQKKPFLRSWRRKTAIGVAVLSLAFSVYLYQKHNIDMKYEPLEWKIDSAYAANSVPIREERLRTLARLSEKYSLVPGQLVLLTRVLGNLESKKDSVALYLSEKTIDEERVLLNLKAYKNSLLTDKSISGKIELLRNSIVGKQHNEENRQRLLCIVYILEGAKNLSAAERQRLLDIL